MRLSKKPFKVTTMLEAWYTQGESAELGRTASGGSTFEVPFADDLVSPLQPLLSCLTPSCGAVQDSRAATMLASLAIPHPMPGAIAT